mmetsp:Transcript_3026/g.2918  ORF Transcript_3026/g.2918 Transcript_3026/m.2918 type:complete len:284 (-) Transcript_3026:56-907(-)|eukprot:CAMPEP_0197828604 /NCGR_PEP_ID=MMETSP1437-20131217/5135_1 /TAXON_ID=49252 ORGANISM="Eucampia antarctica, Strain CCMP1452" /NCGR_SAMPLE_ID=MMETSP1437 /ASSEMBLY_ACC=CAM_ASM_001096 /LENGTH=283 /DNA_ID=CAMNT_0043429873 /DNA_START=81 /DNA_END=932 /DNA_ORIENTATION=+
MSSTNSALAVAAVTGSVLLVAAAASSLFSSKGESKTDEPLSKEDCIKANEVVRIFDALFIQMQSVLAQLSQQIQQIQMSGQQIPENQLRQLLVAEFERALLVKQESLLQEHKIDEDCLRDATWQMMALPEDYAQVVKSVERFQKLYENISGQTCVGRRPGDGKGSQNNNDGLALIPLTQDQLIEAATIYFESLTAAMGDIVRQFKEMGKDLKDPAVAQQLQMKFASTANDAGEAALKTKAGCNLDSFKAAIEKYAQNPDVGRALAMLQMKQQQELMALGVAPM